MSTPFSSLLSPTPRSQSGIRFTKRSYFNESRCMCMGCGCFFVHPTEIMPIYANIWVQNVDFLRIRLFISLHVFFISSVSLGLSGSMLQGKRKI
jgi:hypothetical protein